MKKVNRRRATVVAVVAAVMTAFAVSAGGATASPARTSAKTTNTITIGVAGIPPFWYGFRTYLAADSSFGFYRKAGVNVEIKPFATGEDSVRAVVAGQIDAAWADSGLGMILISKGTPLVGIEGMDKMDYVLATKDPSITGCSSIKGTTVVVEAIGSSRYHALQSMLKKACNMSINDVKVVAMASGQLQAALSGQVQMGVFHLNDLATANDQGQPLHVLIRIGQTDPLVSYDILWTKRDTLAQKRSDFVKVIKGDVLASRYMYKPKNFDTVAKFTSVTGANLNVGAFALREFLKLGYWPLNRSGLGSGTIIHTMAENVQFGNIVPSAAPTYKQIVDTSVWKAAWKQLAPKKATPPKKKK